MKTRLKYSLILISTLIMGMAIGFLISGRLTSTKVEKIKSYYTDKGFNREFMGILRPTPEQRDELIPILRKHAALNRELMMGFREGQKELFFNLKDELKEHLDDDQMKRLDLVWEKRKQRFKNAKPNHPRKGRKGMPIKR